jgi:hypothetical protein
MRLQARLLTLLVAAVACALAAAGCGGGGGGGIADESATQILQDTFRSQGKIDSGRLTLAVNADLKGVQGVKGPVALKLSGPFQSAGQDGKLPKFAFTLTVDSDGQTTQAGATSTGDKGFLSFQGNAYAVPDQLFRQFEQGYADAQKQAQSQSKDQPTLQALGIDPLRWVTDPKKAGEAQVGGTDTVHVTAGVDVTRLMADVQKALSRAGSVSQGAQQLSQADVERFRKSVKSAKVDVFTGKDDKRLRKFDVALQLTSGTLGFTLQLADLDQAQSIEAPRDAKPIQDLVAQFQAATGLGAAGSAAGGSNGAAASGAANERYLRCLQDAGQDLTKVQACAKYL